MPARLQGTIEVHKECGDHVARLIRDDETVEPGLYGRGDTSVEAVGDLVHTLTQVYRQVTIKGITWGD